jgi:hypothetical protein
MSVDERRRLELADAAKRTFGDDAGITLMELLPPVGWADVATKQDLVFLRDELRNEFRDLRRDVDIRFEQGFRQMLLTLSSLVIAGFLVGTFALVAATLVR